MAEQQSPPPNYNYYPNPDEYAAREPREQRNNSILHQNPVSREIPINDQIFEYNTETTDTNVGNQFEPAEFQPYVNKSSQYI